MQLRQHGGSDSDAGGFEGAAYFGFVPIPYPADLARDSKKAGKIGRWSVH